MWSSCDLTNSVVDAKVLRHSHLLLPGEASVDVLESPVDSSPSISYQNEQEAENEIANVTDDVVEGREGECARDSPRVTA